MSCIKDELAYIREKVDEILVTTTKNEEHLRSINGIIKRHEDILKSHSKKINNLYYYLGFAFGVVSVIVLIVQVIL
ncbi:hypothetical protein J7J18_06595 [bacterium]|nr:hypothetical protein [bacterium]